MNHTTAIQAIEVKDRLHPRIIAGDGTQRIISLRNKLVISFCRSSCENNMIADHFHHIDELAILNIRLRCLIFI
ncbi:hypothetical protein D3C76_860800 [compost metagenome]